MKLIQLSMIFALMGCGANRGFIAQELEVVAKFEGPKNTYVFIKEIYHHTMSVPPGPYVIITSKEGGKTLKVSFAEALELIKFEINCEIYPVIKDIK